MKAGGLEKRRPSKTSSLDGLQTGFNMMSPHQLLGAQQQQQTMQHLLQQQLLNPQQMVQPPNMFVQQQVSFKMFIVPNQFII